MGVTPGPPPSSPRDPKPWPAHRVRLALVALWVLLVAGLTGCGGGGSTGTFSSAGIANGTIVGTVFGIVGGSPGLTPLAGVRVTAARVQGGTPLVRSGFTDFSGGYVLFDVPLGTWELSYQLAGFAGVTSSTPVRTFVDSASVAVVGDVTLLQTGASGSGNVTLFVVDGATGQPVLGASVTVGGFPPSFVGFDGSYVFQVPVSGGFASLPILVTHPGFVGQIPIPSAVTPVAGFPVALTVSLEPSQSFVTGVLQPASFATLYSSVGAFGQVSITSPQVSQAFLDPLVDLQTGQFQVRVPASTVGGSQFMSLVFTSPFFQQAQVSGILTPGPGGTASLSSPVSLLPLTATILGNVVNSQGGAPSGFPNQVVLVETGQAANLVNGSYALAGVPAGLPFTLQASVVGPLGGEFGQVFLTPLPGTFQAPVILTN